MNNELIVLLGCGLAAFAVTNACTSMYEKAEESDDENEYEGFSCGGYKEEGYGGCGSVPSVPLEQYKKNKMSAIEKAGRSVTSVASFKRLDANDRSVLRSQFMWLPNSRFFVEKYEAPLDKFAVDYFQEPVSEAPMPQNVSPLMFGTMVGVGEPYENDYIEMKNYTANPDELKVYNEKDDTIGLPVTDMTDLSAGENNKYIYDRTIGTIGFTSTKIGGRFRGQADYIRGDLGIIPDKTGWFQVSSDPANKLMVGAMNVANGIGSMAPSSSAPKEAGHAMGGKPKTLDDLIADKDKTGRANAMGGVVRPPREFSASDIIAASQLQNTADYKGINQ